MQITTLRKKGSLSNEELDLVKSKYSQWVKTGCSSSKEMAEVIVPRLIKTVEILKNRLEYEAQLESRTAALQGQLNEMMEVVEQYENIVSTTAPERPMQSVATDRKNPAVHEWKSVQELANLLGLSTSYIHNMATGAAKNRYGVERRSSKALRRKYDYRVTPE